MNKLIIFISLVDLIFGIVPPPYVQPPPPFPITDSMLEFDKLEVKVTDLQTKYRFVIPVHSVLNSEYFNYKLRYATEWLNRGQTVLNKLTVSDKTPPPPCPPPPQITSTNFFPKWAEKEQGLI